MVETRRSSAAKRLPPSPAQSSSSSRGAKRPKVEAEAEAVSTRNDAANSKEAAAKAASEEPQELSSAPLNLAAAAPAEIMEVPTPESADLGVSSAARQPVEKEPLAKTNLDPLEYSRKRLRRGQPKAAAWGKLLSQSSQNPHLAICGSPFTVGHSRKCNLRLSDSSAGTTVCRLSQSKHGGTSVTLLENLGAKGVVLVNGKTIEKNANVVLTGGDEVVFSSNGHHAYVSFLILGGVLHSNDIYSQKLETRKR